MPLAVQVICHRGRPVAVTIGADEAAITGSVAPADLRVVQAMCVYALEIAAGDRSGPYRDADAERHALQITSRVASTARSRRGACPDR